MVHFTSRLFGFYLCLFTGTAEKEHGTNLRFPVEGVLESPDFWSLYTFSVRNTFGNIEFPGLGRFFCHGIGECWLFFRVVARQFVLERENDTPQMAGTGPDAGGASSLRTPIIGDIDARFRCDSMLQQ